MKKVLEEQIREKKNKEDLIKQYDKKYEEVVKNNVGEYNKHLEEIEKNKQNKKLFYKKELDSQIIKKNNLNGKYHMNESEKMLNKEILNQIIIINK